MSDARRADTALIDSALEGGPSRVRAAAALAAGQAQARTRAPRLRALLRDADTAVAANAAFALGLLRDTAAVGALAAALEVEAPVALEAAWALGEIGEPARGAIVEALGTMPITAAALPELLHAAAKLRPMPIDAVGRFTMTDYAPVVIAGTYAIARSRVPGGARALISIARQPQPRLTLGRYADARPPVPDSAERAALAQLMATVARGLAQSATGDSLRAGALPALEALARHPHPHVRINALRSLGTYGGRGRATLLAAAGDADANVRITAAAALGAIGDSTLPWGELWRADTSLAYRGALLTSALAAGGALSEGLAWSAAGDWRARATLAGAAASARRFDELMAIVSPLLGDPDPRVRTAAFAAIASRADSVDSAPRAREILLERGLSDPDVAARATALGALTARASGRELPHVLRSYTLAANDTANDARLAAVQYIAASWRADSAGIGDSVRGALAALPAPSDPLERRAAAGISPLGAWPDAGGTPRPHAWYEEIVREIAVPARSGRPPRAVLHTDRGVITLELFGADAPLTVANFVTLARSGFYDRLRFHRVVPNFVVQDGDPRGDGNGGPGWSIRDELNRRRYERGVLGMALSGPDTGGSQYFITHSPQPHLDGHYTVFGRVVGGFDALDAIVQGDGITRITIQ